MGNDALPCVRCGARLENVDAPWTENQPYEGTAFKTHGHYGSTVFDPMDGSFLEINLCDVCLAKAGDEGRVLVGKNKRSVLVQEPDMRLPTHVGWERVERPLVPWRKGLPGYGDGDVLEVELVELAEPIGGEGHVEWSPAAAAIKARHGENDASTKEVRPLGDQAAP